MTDQPPPQMTPEEIRALDFEPHTEGDWPPDHVTETPMAYEVMRNNGYIQSADDVSDSYWLNGGKSHARGVVGYRLACPHAREEIAAKDAEIERLREAVVRAAEQFEQYAALHYAKGTADGDEKGSVNGSLGKRMRYALLETTNG